MKTTKIMEGMATLLISAAVCLLTTGCWDDGEAMDATPNGDYMNCSDVVVAGSSQTGTIHVEANCQWTISTADTWLSLSASGGEGNGDVTLTMTTNPSSLEKRQATVTLRSAGGIVMTISVRQERSAEQISLTPQTLEFQAMDDAYQEVTVTSNSRWTVTGRPEWLTLSTSEGTGNGSIQVSAATNTTNSVRTATLTLTCAAKRTATFTVSQEAGELPVVGSLLLIDSNEEQATMTSSLTSMFTITEYGICYGEKMNPTVVDSKVIAGRNMPEDGTFTATISGLTKGITYHARAYAVSVVGTSYGEDFEFVALSVPKNDENDRPQF